MTMKTFEVNKSINHPKIGQNSFRNSLSLFQTLAQISRLFENFKLKMDKISIRKTFAGKTILITGATGLIGKVLVEKFLYDVDGIKTIYILFRSKRGSDFQQRFEKYKESKAFDRVKVKNPELLKKIKPINADLFHAPYLGISHGDLELFRKEVGVVFHLAATVKFNEPLEMALRLNMIATDNLLKIAKTFDKLEAFVYVSTAFSNVHVATIKEIIHHPLYDYKAALKATMERNYDELSKMNEIVLKNFPNTYTFSKHLTEQLVNGYSHEMPIVIIRPSIVSPSFKEPFKGWNDNINNFMALSAGVANGIIRVVHIGKDLIKSDFLPCDFVTHSMMTAAAEKISSDDKSIKVLNCSMGIQFPNSFKTLTREFEQLTINHFPYERMIWYPKVEFCAYYPVYLVKFFLYQMLPALFIDFLLILMWKKPFLVKAQKTIFKAMEGFHYFMWNEWIIENKNYIDLHGKLCDEEK